MAELGINNVLPIAAGPGLEINGNVISISQTEPITVRKILFLPQAGDVAIQVNQDDTGTSNAIFVVDKDDLYNLFINGSGNMSQSDNTDSLLVVKQIQYTPLAIYSINFDGVTGARDEFTILSSDSLQVTCYTDNLYTKLSKDRLVTSYIQTTGINNSAPLVSFDSIDGTVTVPNGSINATLDGTPTKIGSQQ